LVFVYVGVDFDLEVSISCIHSYLFGLYGYSGKAIYSSNSLEIVVLVAEIGFGDLSDIKARERPLDM
jgi:hypothetical protein